MLDLVTFCVGPLAVAIFAVARHSVLRHRHREVVTDFRLGRLGMVRRDRPPALPIPGPGRRCP